MSVTEEPKVSTPTLSEPAKEKAPLVAVNTENTEFSAGLLGGIAGERVCLFSVLSASAFVTTTCSILFVITVILYVIRTPVVINTGVLVATGERRRSVH